MIFASRALRSSLLAACVLPLALDIESANAQDIVIPSGSNLTIDTAFASVPISTGGVLLSSDGFLFVDSFTVEDGATVRVIGPYPLRIISKGEIDIFGHVDVSGTDAVDVFDALDGAISQLFTFSTIPEIGGIGGAGGGMGGNSSVITDGSTVHGMHGLYWMRNPNGGGGGGGGESGFGAGPNANTPSKVFNSNPKFRRGAGGGGGSFGPDAIATTPISLSFTGLVAQPGSNGDPLAMGSLGNAIPRGGRVTQSPFRDGDPNNDFWGAKIDRATGQLVFGELPAPQGGAGGGGAGDSVRSTSFPNPNFTIFSEDKGGAGGGGGGAIHLRAHGRISLFNTLTGTQGSISANGGNGARGQTIAFLNNFFTKSGAGGGAGSGGHIVIESSTSIELGSSMEVLQARGGIGGPGTASSAIGKGGDGGPGVIQLHAPQGKANILSTQQLNLVAVPKANILLPRVNTHL